MSPHALSALAFRSFHHLTELTGVGFGDLAEVRRDGAMRTVRLDLRALVVMADGIAGYVAGLWGCPRRDRRGRSLRGKAQRAARTAPVVLLSPSVPYSRAARAARKTPPLTTFPQVRRV